VEAAVTLGHAMKALWQLVLPSSTSLWAKAALGCGAASFLWSHAASYVQERKRQIGSVGCCSTWPGAVVNQHNLKQNI